MANGQHGGYRRPAKPAPVSGPGAMSKRTDGRPKMQQLPDARYGEQATFQADQQGAPMGSPATPGGMSAGGAGAPAPMPPGLDGPSMRPDEPVTAGSPLGAGVGPEAIGLGPKAVEAEDLDRLRRYLPALVEMANRPDATPSLRNYVRVLRAKLL